MRLYKLRHRITRLYWTGGGYFSRQWGPKGKLYARMADLHTSIRTAGRRGNQEPYTPENYEVEIYEATLVDTVDYKRP